MIAVLLLSLAIFSCGAQPVFTRDVAPVVFQKCSGCHRPGQSAPFQLLTYQDCSKHARQMAEVTARHLMPPWLPDPAYGHYFGERLLNPAQIKLFADWAAAGAPEGSPSDLPPLPSWPEGWTLGKPDLIIQTPLYTLPGEGRDVYRNFVVPLNTTRTQYVSAVEFHPGNARVAHHAFIMFDRTHGSRELDEKDPAPGFDGMDIPPTSESPDGHFLSWQPGKQFTRNPEGLSWRLYPNSDMVLQMHLQPSGKSETIQSSTAFYFTDQPPTRFPLKLVLTSYEIDIPAGEANYTISNSFKVPVDLEVLSLLPHAHYLGKDLQGFAILPDGRTNWLIRIPDWNFNWQGDYRLQTPVFIPRGSTLVMKFTYDNSAHNPHNPTDPPVRVKYGARTRDEMGELWIQTLPRNPADYHVLHEALQGRVFAFALSYAQALLRQNPNDSKAHLKYAKALLAKGERREALPHFRTAAQADPADDESHYYLGLLARLDNQPTTALEQFSEAVRLNAKNARAFGNLGLVYLEEKNLPAAEKNFLRAVEIEPQDAISLDGLGMIYFEQGRYARAESSFRKATAAAPNDAEIREHLKQAEGARRR